MCDSRIGAGVNVIKLRPPHFLPSLWLAIERVGQRSVLGVSPRRHCISANAASIFTHPNIAALVHPLYGKP